MQLVAAVAFVLSATLSYGFITRLDARTPDPDLAPPAVGAGAPDLRFEPLLDEVSWLGPQGVPLGRSGPEAPASVDAAPALAALSVEASPIVAEVPVGDEVAFPPNPFLELDSPERTRVEAPASPADVLDDTAGSTINVITGYVPRGGSLATALAAEGVEPGQVHNVNEVMRPVFDFRRAQPGDFFALIEDEQGELMSFEFRRGRRDIYRLERDAGGTLRAGHSEAPLERRVARLGGVVDTSLFDSILDLGEGADLVSAFVDIFQWDFDFSTQTRPGDEFRLVFEKFYDREGFVSYGTVLAARYETSQREYTAVYFEEPDGYSDYYTLEGKSVRRTFLRAPVKYTRISSRYTKSRLHPILKVRRPHEGIDYAAPRGTPIWAVADGKVTFRGWSGGFGRLVKIRHDNGYVSYYGHLSRFAHDVLVGDRIRQQKVIGYVGSTGLATGPHLDYRLRRNGRFVDPLKVKLPEGRPVSVKRRIEFDRVKKARLAELNEAAPAFVLEAAM